MSTYILVHGAWHGSWCWRKVIPLLQWVGHTVIAPDLPGHGDDLTPLAAVTLASYVQCVTDILDAQPIHEQVILVGHSLAGMVISQVAEERAERIERLVYLSAFLPKNGESAMQITQGEDNSHFDDCTEADALSVRLLPEKASALFYQDCEPEDIRYAAHHLTPQAILPLTTPVTLTERFLRVPRTYITCRYDLVIPPALQSRMYGATLCERVVWSMTGHSPFLATPERLAARLHGLSLPPYQPAGYMEQASA